jgi:hypothetical protein
MIRYLSQRKFHALAVKIIYIFDSLLPFILRLVTILYHLGGFLQLHFKTSKTSRLNLRNLIRGGKLSLLGIEGKLSISLPLRSRLCLYRIPRPPTSVLASVEFPKCI